MLKNPCPVSLSMWGFSGSWSGLTTGRARPLSEAERERERVNQDWVADQETRLLLCSYSLCWISMGHTFKGRWFLLGRTGPFRLLGLEPREGPIVLRKSGNAYFSKSHFRRHHASLIPSSDQMWRVNQARFSFVCLHANYHGTHV